mmetsp:Transcript_9622/g.28154  ORF Transcript_9622/g.28154 Transcript_9622/m.28154 type:complete len:501 (-) Transcript_9622:46-1548(-)
MGFFKDRGLDPATTPVWVCAHALNQHDLGAELAGGVRSGPFVRALALADGAVSIVDENGEYFTRVWCALELYMSLVGSLRRSEHAVVTALAKPVSRGRHEGAAHVSLLEGFAVEDDGDSERKLARESEFPSDLLVRVDGFTLDAAQASRPEDLEEIKLQVGEDARTLEATLRACFLNGRLTEALLAGPEASALLDARLSDVRASHLRLLSLYFEGGATEERTHQLMAALPGTLRALLLEKAHAAVLAPAVELVRRDQLERLQLRYCDLKAQAASVLAKTLAAAPGGRLTTLDLQGNDVGNEGARALAKALPGSRSLTALSLPANSIRASGAGALAEALRVNHALRDLNLRYNDVGDGGAVSLAEALPHNKVLRNLVLSGNGIRDEGAQALADALTRNQALRNLDLQGNEIGDEGALALAEALPHNQTLQDFRLGDNRVGDGGALALAGALSHNHALQSLNLGRNERIGSKAENALRAAWVSSTVSGAPRVDAKLDMMKNT